VALKIHRQPPLVTLGHTSSNLHYNILIGPKLIYKEQISFSSYKCGLLLRSYRVGAQVRRLVSLVGWCLHNILMSWCLAEEIGVSSRLVPTQYLVELVLR
jgi:hypothetical protein